MDLKGFTAEQLVAIQQAIVQEKKARKEPVVNSVKEYIDPRTKKAHKVLSMPIKEDSSYCLTVGLGKAQCIITNIETIKKFVASGGLTI